METRSSVRGVLRDASGRPVKEATVMITGGSHEFNDMASITNDSGEFHLSNVVIPGEYTLQIEGNGQSITKQVNLKDTSDISVNF